MEDMGTEVRALILTTELNAQATLTVVARQTLEL